MFFLPLFDENTPKSKPYVNWLIIGLCIVIFVYQVTLLGQQRNHFILNYAAIPLFITDGQYLTTLVSSAFLHGGWLHLGGNMLFLWIFGDNIEDRMGHGRFTIFYLLCAVLATLAHVAAAPDSATPLVGASGAIAGVLASYLITFPKARVRVLLIIIIFIRLIYVPAFVVIGGWAIIQFLSAPASLGNDGGGVAYFAHIGGFIAGLILTPFFRKSQSPDLDTETPDFGIRPVPMRQIKNEWVERYRYRSRRDIPNVKRKP